MPVHSSPDASVETFIARWSTAQAAERANYALFLSELCDVIGVPRPDPASQDAANNSYVFERAVTFHERGSGKTSIGRIDLYKRSSFVLEAKQYAGAKSEAAELALDLGDPDAPARSAKVARGTAAWDRAMLEALGQAENYARSLPADEDPPPFLLVVDVGHVFELYADFTQKGKNYLPFPDARAYRIRLAELTKPEVRDTLRAVWTDPHSLDPSKKAAAVTREVAGYLAELAKSFEKRHDPKLVAEFLSRCLFCMFAEDVGLLPKESFRQLLDGVKDDPGAFVPLLELLFEDMNHGRFSGLLKKKLPYFNGGLFASARALPVNGAQLGLLRRAAALEWRHVEPAIFGTLLERALHPEERHKLGAHYTPRAYVERLVLPTVIEPLREEWASVRVAAVTLAQRDTAADLKRARATVRQFHERLCAVRVLDPACGSGNFLYVSLEQVKRLEGEVIALLHDLGDTGTLNLQGVTVDPHQFLGIELNPRAAAIAELVLWIGYLQWHFRVHGDAMPAEPVLKKFNNIECRDAVLAYDRHAFAQDPATGKTRFVWDRKSYKTDPVTGREVPDEARVRPLDTYENPRPAEWPQADFIVGNPPFLGNKRMRDDLGDGYTEALRSAYPATLEGADFVMFWWHKAAKETLASRTRRFGFITTNSLRQSSNRRVMEPHLVGEQCVSLRFAIPDHPWVDSADGAAVRIAMTVAGVRKPGRLGELATVISEESDGSGEAIVSLSTKVGEIHADLTTGANLTSATPLKSNESLSFMGVTLVGDFTITQEELQALKLVGSARPEVVKRYLIGKDLTQEPRGSEIIDFFGLTEVQARQTTPQLFDRLLANVKPQRAQNKRASYRERWWIFAEPRTSMRAALIGLPRYIATPETAKHRFFVFVAGDVVLDHSAFAIALADAFHLGVLSSRVHVIYSLAAGGTLEDRPRYRNARCFDPFPFPDCTEKQKDRIRVLAEELDAHRKRAQATHRLGLTDIYNVLEKLRAGQALTAKDRAVHDAALVSTLKQLHDDLDAAVADAYGWPWPLADAEILERVVALNAARAAEEAQGLVRWLRPDYQKPLLAPSAQTTLAIDTSGRKPRAAKAGAKTAAPAPEKPSRAGKLAWPKTLAERAKAVESALKSAAEPVTAEALAKRFLRAKSAEVAEILETLAALGRARSGDEKGTYLS